MARNPAPVPPTKPGPDPDEAPVPGPKGPRTPYPVDDPGVIDQPGADPDYIPGTPVQPGKQKGPLAAG
jgi:hypothetical protein